MLEVYVLKPDSLVKMIKEESKKFLFCVFVLYLIFQIYYYKDNPFNVIKIIIAQVYLFILPGFIIMLYFQDKINFIYRMIIGIGIGYSLNIIITYYINLIIKVNIGKFYWITPILMIILGCILIWIKNRKKSQRSEDDQRMSV